MSSKSFMVFTAFACAVSTAHANTPIPTQVREMLQIDADIALLNERKRLDEAMGVNKEDQPAGANAAGQVAPTDEPSKPEPVSLRMLGIFGIGTELYADISINGERVRFKQGQTQAERVTPDYPYQLKAIAPPCATLMADGMDLPVCLSGKE